MFGTKPKTEAEKEAEKKAEKEKRKKKKETKALRQENRGGTGNAKVRLQKYKQEEGSIE